MKNFIKSMLVVPAFCMTFVAPAFADENVDLQLQLLMDVSGSISSSEYQLQMQGYSYAFQDQIIQDNILSTVNGDYGKIAVQAVMWSSPSSQQVMTDWTLLDSAQSINDYADTLLSINRPFGGSTYNAQALDYGSALFSNSGYTSTRNVIDMSGDGYGYDYLYSQYMGTSIGNYLNLESTSEARDNALAGDITTINGLTITYDYQQVGAQDLTSWYAANVIGGVDAFVLQAGDFTDFRTALSTKLAAEIEGGYIPTNAITQGEVYSAPSPVAGTGVFALLILLMYRQFQIRAA